MEIVTHFWDKRQINKDQSIDTTYAETNRQWFKAITIKHIQGHKRKYVHYEWNIENLTEIETITKEM